MNKKLHACKLVYVYVWALPAEGREICSCHLCSCGRSSRLVIISYPIPSNSVHGINQIITFISDIRCNWRRFVLETKRAEYFFASGLLLSHLKHYHLHIMAYHSFYMLTTRWYDEGAYEFIDHHSQHHEVKEIFWLTLFVE